MAAGMQVLTHLPWTLIVGMPSSTTTRDVLMAAGWVINIAVVEWLIATRLRRSKPKRRMPSASVASGA
jgi:hypothetical protein